MSKNYYVDCEFHTYSQRPKWFGRPIPFTKGTSVIDLISIGIVDAGGREFYAISNEFDIDDAWANKWIRENVLLSILEELREKEFEKTRKGLGLGIAPDSYSFKTALQELKYLLGVYGNTKGEIKAKIEMFFECEEAGMKQDEKINLFGYYSACDFVALTQLWGGEFHKLPKYFRSYMTDLKQMAAHNHITDWDIPKENEHNALDDAKWNQKLHNLLKRVSEWDETKLSKKSYIVLGILQDFLARMVSQQDFPKGGVPKVDNFNSLYHPQDIWDDTYEPLLKISMSELKDLSQTNIAYLQALAKKWVK
jgi:hypothetical protein